MLLKEYLKKEGMTYKEFAERLGIHIHSLKNIAYGARRPSLALSLKIEDETKGLVTSRELYNEFQQGGKKSQIKSESSKK
jgi:transcriptional regulator with XRE-family HTH domain